MWRHRLCKAVLRRPLGAQESKRNIKSLAETQELNRKPSIMAHNASAMSELFERKMYIRCAIRPKVFRGNCVSKGEPITAEAPGKKPSN
jgi:hypothetical protein